jgi:glutamate N-acetyltransferase / amino-acid N-acetyltransferase
VAVLLKEPTNLSPIAGIRLATANASIYKNERDDISLIEIAEGSSFSAVFTKNAFCAAPVIVAKAHLNQHSPRYCLINAGNANAGTGSRGYEDTLNICQTLASQLGCLAEQVLPFSTGVIGEFLPVENIKQSFPTLHASLHENSWLSSAHAIKTTDTVAKGVTKSIMLGDKPVKITGIAKGSGMIRPDMATMLAFVGTDIGINQGLLDEVLENTVAQSFNRICVDGDTSTNDACVLMATGKSDVHIIDKKDPLLLQFQNELDLIFVELAQSIVRDGEGATKFVSVVVKGGSSNRLCRDVAYDIATSPLVKTALFAEDPNWGRIIAAVGRSREKEIFPEKVSVYIDEVCIIKNGEQANSYTESQGQKVMSRADITISIDLGLGKHVETVWTCDLSYEYIKINAEYRS